MFECSVTMVDGEWNSKQKKIYILHNFVSVARSLARSLGCPFHFWIFSIDLCEWPMWELTLVGQREISFFFVIFNFLKSSFPLERGERERERERAGVSQQSIIQLHIADAGRTKSVTKCGVGCVCVHVIVPRVQTKEKAQRHCFQTKCAFHWQK